MANQAAAEGEHSSSSDDLPCMAGIFLDCRRLPRDGGIAAYTKRVAMRPEGTPEWALEWPGDGGNSLATYMDANHLAMLVITEADCAT